MLAALQELHYRIRRGGRIQTKRNVSSNPTENIREFARSRCQQLGRRVSGWLVRRRLMGLARSTVLFNNPSTLYEQTIFSLINNFSGRPFIVFTHLHLSQSRHEPTKNPSNSKVC
jgi:hypothetical protein